MKFLVIRFSSLGDVIITTAFLKTLKSAYPNSEVHYVTKQEFADILKAQPYIDRVIELKKGESIIDLSKKISKERFDCIFDLHKNIRSLTLSFFIKSKSIKRVNKHILYRYKLLHKKLLFFIKDRDTTYNIEDQIKLINKNISSNQKPVLYTEKHKINTKKPLIGIAPGAKWQTKMWPDTYFKKLIKLINDNMEASVVIFGSKEEKNLAETIAEGFNNVINLSGKLSIRETASYMANCDIMVSNDSALMHMATALDIPVVAIFGPTVKEFGFFPTGRAVVLEDKTLKCRPCSLHGTSKCPKKHHKCMKNITPESVFKAITNLIKGGNYEQR